MLVAIIAAFVIILDQVSKYLVRELIEMGHTVDVIPWFVNFTHTENKGAAWGIFADDRWVFLIFSSVAIVALTVFVIKVYRRSRVLNVGIAMVLGGGIGNMIDRIILGQVTDFMYFTFFDFPVFNVADSFVCIGAVIIGVYVIFIDPKIEKRLKASAQDAPKDDGEAQ